MRKYGFAVIAALSIYSGGPAFAQGTPVIDNLSLAKLGEEVSTLKQQLTAVTGVLQQTQTMVNQIGYPVRTLINAEQQLSNFKNLSWYTPQSASSILTSVPNLSWDTPANSRQSTQNLFYVPSTSSSGGAISGDTQIALQTRREAAVRDAATNAYALVQQYRNNLSSLQDDISRLTAEANGATVSQIEQANADISLTILKFQVTQSNLIAAMAQLEAAQAINNDTSYATN